MDAIYQAAVQVLLKEGKGKLTTTRIAERAGVSVGTLYQYFPNKRALLSTMLQDLMDGVAASMESACERARGTSLPAMAEAITTAFVEAKFRHIDASVALYTVTDDIEGRRIARDMYRRAGQAMATLFESAAEQTIAEPQVVSLTILSAMTGVSRAMLEQGVQHDTRVRLQRELARMVRAYLEASAGGAKPLAGGEARL